VVADPVAPFLGSGNHPVSLRGTQKVLGALVGVAGFMYAARLTSAAPLLSRLRT